MSKPKVLILRTAGTNCDLETAHAWELAGANPQRVHVRELIDAPARLDDFAILTIPGGFSYGDDIAAGKILAVQLVHHLADRLKRFIEAGRLVLGICNGFQVLVKAGLLPGFADNDGPGATDPGPGATAPAAARVRQTVTLTDNDSARFEDRWIHLRTSVRANAFLPDERVIALPIAHGEGKLVSAGEDVRRRLHTGGHVALTYCDSKGKPGPYPINPNGSEDDIAGLVDATGQVLGLMPHPERHVYGTQHPEWTRGRPEAGDGRVFFETAVRRML
ncbi:MAG: hypothetical protein AMXMBFR13_17500 [Phycisphaerae bacterium]